MPTTDRSAVRRRIPLPLGCITLALGSVVAALALLATGAVLSGCGRLQGRAPSRIVEREETAEGIHVRLKSELSPARGTLGDPITWRLTATLGAGATADTVIMAGPPASLELDRSRPATETKTGAGHQWSREVLLRGFDIGAIPLPQAALLATAAGRTDTLQFPHDTLFVDSLTQSATGNIRPDRGPIMPPLRPVDYVVVAMGVLLLLGLIAFLIRLWLKSRRKKEASGTPAPPDPPETILARALDVLEREVARLPRDVFYERLAQALRAYAAAVTGVPAIDLTTTELDRELKGRAEVSAEGREALMAALRRADLAKFARFEDEESEARSILNETRSVSGKL